MSPMVYPSYIAKARLVQDLCTGGELFDRIIAAGHYTEHDAKKLMYKLLGAVNHCHAKVPACV